MMDGFLGVARVLRLLQSKAVCIEHSDSCDFRILTPLYGNGVPGIPDSYSSWVYIKCGRWYGLVILLCRGEIYKQWIPYSGYSSFYS